MKPSDYEKEFELHDGAHVFILKRGQKTTYYWVSEKEDSARPIDKKTFEFLVYVYK